MKYIILVNERQNEMYVNLSIKIIYNYINKYISDEIEIIHLDNFDFENINPNAIYISYSFKLYNYIHLLLNAKLIIINMDHYKHFNFSTILNLINTDNSNIVIFDYNPINIIGINNDYKFIKIYYMPLVFDTILINYYNNFITNKINFNEKKIDILFYGSINERRNNILNILSKKYNVCIINSNNVNTIPDNELINYIENSKIVLNIYYYEHNKIFDYYRNSFLLANNAFLVTEYPDNINFNIDKNLIDIEKNIVCPSYNDIVKVIDKILIEYNQDDINILIKKQNNWFRQFDSKYFYDKFFIVDGLLKNIWHQPRINLIISSYSGIIPKYKNNKEMEFYLRYNIALLNKIKTNISQISIIKPKVDNDHIEIKDYYNFTNIDIKNIENKIKIYECENIGVSYGQFFSGISNNLDFDYHIFIEDYYIIFKDYFEIDLINTFNKNENDSLLCAFIYKNKLWDVKKECYDENIDNLNLLENNLILYNAKNLICNIPDFSLCILSKFTIHKLLEKFINFKNIISFFDIKFKKNYIYQILFGYILNIANIKLYDYSSEYLNIFCDIYDNHIIMTNHQNKKQNEVLTLINKKLNIPLFIPLDILCPNNIYYLLRLNIIINNLSDNDKTEFITIYNKLTDVKKYYIEYYKKLDTVKENI